jgi:6-phospho-beta-glucosidase
MKIATIGGGSTYSPELVKGFLERHARLGLGELWLMDVDEERLAVVGEFARRMVVAEGAPFQVHLTTDRRAALEGAAFVTTQIRVGQMAARREDEYLGRRWNLVGQETTGIGGMAKALRTVPVLVDIARDMADLCPDAWLINFSNPSGLVTEALQRYVPKVRSVGLCNSPIGYQMAIARELELGSPFDVYLDYVGLNHLAWIRGARVGGRDIWPQVFARAVQEAQAQTHPVLPADLMERLGVICSYYLRYYYSTSSVLREQAKGKPSRAEQVIEIERRLLEQYADPQLHTMPEALLQRGGAYYSTAATQLIEAIALDLGEVHIVNTRQMDAVSGVPPHWVMELPCRVDARGLRPLQTDPLPAFADGLLRTVKAYELLTAQAAVSGDHDAAVQALLIHPLGPDAEQVLEVWQDLLDTHRSYLPLFDGVPPDEDGSRVQR